MPYPSTESGPFPSILTITSSALRLASYLAFNLPHTPLGQVVSQLVPLLYLVALPGWIMRIAFSLKRLVVVKDEVVEPEDTKDYPVKRRKAERTVAQVSGLCGILWGPVGGRAGVDAPWCVDYVLIDTYLIGNRSTPASPPCSHSRRRTDLQPAHQRLHPPIQHPSTPICAGQQMEPIPLFLRGRPDLCKVCLVIPRTR